MSDVVSLADAKTENEAVDSIVRAATVWFDSMFGEPTDFPMEDPTEKHARTEAMHHFITACLHWPVMEAMAMAQRTYESEGGTGKVNCWFAPESLNPLIPIWADKTP